MREPTLQLRGLKRLVLIFEARGKLVKPRILAPACPVHNSVELRVFAEMETISYFLNEVLSLPARIAGKV
jgi:hypothetical protein